MKRIISCIILVLSFAEIAYAQQCTADFSSSVSPGNPNMVQFINQSSHLVQNFDSISYLWDFGDGTFSSQFSPVHTYSSSGSFLVCLTMTIKDSGGFTLCEDTTCKTVNVLAPLFCSSSFGYVPNSFNPNQIQFIDSSFAANIDPSDSIEIRWNFGDGNFGSSGLNGTIFHTYNGFGTYTVCANIIIIDTLGNLVCSDSICLPISINQVPVNCGAGFTWLTDSNSPRTYTFIDTSFYSGPGAGATDSLVWDFGDGNSGTGDTAVHTYAQNGTYTACLTIYVIAQGTVLCSDTVCHTITVSGSPDFCSIEYLIDTVNSYNGLVYIWNLGDSLNPNSNNTYLWDFGDGNFSTQAYPTHNYSLTGNYNVCLTLTATTATLDTCVKTFCDSIKVNPDGSLGFNSGFTLNVLNPLTIGIKEFESTELQVYPNPASDFVKLDLGSSKNQDVYWTIHDMSGSLVLSGKVNKQEEGVKRIDTKNLKAGIYLISVKDNSSVSQRKLKIIRW